MTAPPKSDIQTEPGGPVYAVARGGLHAMTTDKG